MIYISKTTFILVNMCNTFVMGQVPGLEPEGFLEGLRPTFDEGLKHGPGPGPWTKAWGLKGLFGYDFLLKHVQKTLD